MADLPAGTVTFLFSDVERSTRMLERHGARAGDALARHHEIFEAAVASKGGTIFETVGDAVYAAFTQPSHAIRAAVTAQRHLAAEDWAPVEPIRARIAIHTGEVQSRGTHYFGPALFRCARLLAIGHGGQTLVSSVAAGLVGADLGDDIALQDLGTHRLKDLGALERVYQVNVAGEPIEFPPLRSLENHPNNLPQQLTSFVGREDELREIDELLGEVRLLTLLGPGGTGKTRLALQAAADRVERHADGVFFVDLAPISDPELVLPAIANALGVRPDPMQVFLDALVDFLGSRDVILVIDNAEQVLEAAPEVADLLTRTTHVRVLATSRAPLRIRGEHEYHVRPLGLDDRLGAPAVELFVARATDVRSDIQLGDTATLETIRQICARVDGLPLAIELAAARVRVFDPPELLRRLERRLPLLSRGPSDAPRRHRSLQATIEWSANLLSAPARKLLGACAFFVGGWTDDAADAVTGDSDISSDDLVSLVEASLVGRTSTPDGTRFTMLETVREYASTLAEPDRAETIRARHAQYYLALAEELDPQLFGPDGGAKRSQLAVEFGNIEAALRWAIAAKDDSMALRFVWAIRWAWDAVIGRRADGLALSEAALALGEERTRERARALHAVGNLAWTVNDLTKARANWELATSLYREVGDEQGIASMLNNLAEFEPDSARQGQMYLESLAIAVRHGDGHARAQALHNLGVLELMSGRLEAGRKRIEDAVRVARTIGAELQISTGLLLLAEIDLLRGRMDDATDLVRQAEGIARAGDALSLAASAMVLRARIEHALGESDRAIQLLRAALDVPDKHDWRAATIAHVADALASIAVNQGNAPAAARLLGIADAFMLPLGARLSPLRGASVERTVGPARDRLGAEGFESARAAGERLPADDHEMEITRLLRVLESRPGV